MPDLDIVTESGVRRVFSFLHTARSVLISFGASDGIEIGSWSDRVQYVNANYDGQWELPVLGPVAAPAAVLIRPDGHVAWIGDGTAQGLTEVLTTWFGALAKPPAERGQQHQPSLERRKRPEQHGDVLLLHGGDH